MSKLSKLFMAIVILSFAVPAFAQGGEAATRESTGSQSLPDFDGFRFRICALAQGKATASAAESMARNPAARPSIQLALILAWP